jgi:hypothetical protein
MYVTVTKSSKQLGVMEINHLKSSMGRNDSHVFPETRDSIRRHTIDLGLRECQRFSVHSKSCLRVPEIWDQHECEHG